MREVPREDEQELLARLRRGEPQAFETLVIEHQHRVFGVALRMLGSRAEAEDVAQEAFLRAYKSVAEFRGDAKLSTWLYAITSRLCLNRLDSAERRRTRHGDDLLESVPDERVDPPGALE